MFHRCKLRMLPLFAMINDFLEKAEEIMKIDCVVKEFSKGFPRFDIECIMNDDFKEGIDCIKDRDLLSIMGPRHAKALVNIADCVMEATPAA